ncbi:UNVERIFIED_CONTAM: ATP-dependent zinc metalloprotease FTSH 4, mitochondrial [Sesamum radiatum]|uniref:ATP-dependent zinc metalloprotease FTSH 4, mitochondrial n=1 Tax=Sesamum radiatum TaxID=300843 RepID=A0AAW2MIW7_SESRA
MVTAEGGHFKEQLWRTVRSLGMAFLLISGFGALIEDKGIGKVTDGVDEAKAELEEIVHYLRDPKGIKYVDFIAAVLMSWCQASKKRSASWSPATGKTMLARVVSGEAGVLFFSCSGSEFEEVFVGVGARRLLVELDGFKQNEGIIVIAATNFPELLDKALVRLDGLLAILLCQIPMLKGRRQILDSHMSNVLKGEDVDLMIIARRTPGFCVRSCELVHKATIVPRGMALGMVSQLPAKDETSISRKQILSLLDISMGERDAEELIFWESEVSSGVSNDLQQATNLARAMVTSMACANRHGQIVATQSNSQSKAGPPSTPNVAASAAPKAAAAATRAKAIAPVGS